MNNNRLKCFISGATGGLGTALTYSMASMGYELFLTSRSTTKLRALSKEVRREFSTRVFASSGDFNDPADIERIIYRVKSTIGNTDILINNAGVFPILPIGEVTTVGYDRCFDVNVRAAFMFCSAFALDMVRNRWGRIVNIGSSSSYSGLRNTSLYCASKHALLGLSRSLHDELKKYNVRVFCVSPGSMMTDMGKCVPDQDYGTFIDPAEVASAVLHIISFDGNMVSPEIRLDRMVIG